MRKMLDGNVDKLLRDIKRFGILILNAPEPIAVLTHYDADGLTSGGVMARFLAKSEKLFSLRSTPSLSIDTINRFFSIRAKTYIIQDMGSSDLSLIYSKWKEAEAKRIFIIDHHKILDKIPDDNRLQILNPELYGMDGGRTGCTAVLTSLLGYYALGERDPYLLEIGLVGASGDMQLANGTIGINSHLVSLAEEKGIVKREREFVFFTLRRLPVFKAIVWNTVPYIPGFSNREDIGLNIIRRAGIKIRDRNGRYITVSELDEDGRTKLLEIIIQYIASLGIEDLKSEDFLTNVYYLPLEEDPYLETAQQFSNVVSACGRMDREDVGIALSAGSRGTTLTNAKTIIEERKKVLVKYLERAEENIKTYDGLISIIDMRSEEFSIKFSGTISTIFSKSLIHLDKIIIVMAMDEKGEIKLSSRAPRKLVEKGLNLAEIMRKIAEEFGGRGGGHNVAAGASLPVASVEKIIEKIRLYVKDEMKKVEGKNQY